MTMSLLMLALILSRVIGVVGSDQQPLPGARMTVLAADGSSVEATTDEAGLATLEADAGAVVCISAPGHANARHELSPAGPDLVTLVPGVMLQGRVRLAGGSSLRGAKLVVHDPILGSCAPTALTDEDGAYRLSGLRAVAQARLNVSAPGALGLEDLAIRIEATPAHRRDFLLHPAVELSAVVVSAAAPLPGATLRIIPEWEKLGLDPPLPNAWMDRIDKWRGLSDAKGKVALPPLPRRLSWRIACSAEGLAPSSVRVDGRALTALARFTLSSGGGLTLRTVDEEGKPRPAPAAHLRSDSITDADLVKDPPIGGTDGILQIGSLPPGTWTVRLIVPGGVPRVLPGVVVSEGKITELGDVIVPSGASLDGMVVDDAHAPVAGAKVSLAEPIDGRTITLEAITSDAGAFRFDGLDPAARVQLSASAEGHRDASLELVTPGMDGVELTLQRAGRVEGVVKDAASGESLVNATVRLESVADDDSRETINAERGDEGTWTAATVPAGKWRVRAAAAGFLAATSEPVTVSLGGETPSVTLSLERGVSLTGRCVEAESRRGVAGAVVVAKLTSAASASARTDEDGAFTLDGLMGSVDVVARHPLFEDVRSVGVDVATQREPLELVMRAGGSVEGVVRGRDGEVLAGASVTASELSGRDALTEADGSYRIDGIPEGRWKLTKLDRAATYEGREEVVVDVKRGQVTRRDFGGGTRLVGVVRSGGKPVGGVLLGIMEAPDMPTDMGSFDMGKLRSLAARSKDDGHYELTGLEPGRWCVKLTWQGHVIASDVTVPAGVREVTRDIDIPDLRVGGLVVNDDTGEPIAGARATATRKGEGDGRLSLNAYWSESGETEGLAMGTVPEVNDTTGPDGRFELLLPAEGPWTVGAWVWRPEGLAAVGENQVEMDVTASRDDLVFHFAKKKVGVLSVSVVDRATREPLTDAVAYAWLPPGEPTGSTCSPTARFGALTPDTEHLVVAFAKGHAPAVKAGVIVADDGVPVRVEIALARGGDVRLLVPPDALSTNSWGQLSGGLRIVNAEGIEFTRLNNINGTAIAWGAQPISPAEWIFHDMPEGRLVLTLGEGAAARSKTVDVQVGAEAIADLS